jgi:hypothetical protein
LFTRSIHVRNRNPRNRMRESCSSGSVGAPPGNRWRYPDSDLRSCHEHHIRPRLQAGRHRLRPCRPAFRLPPSFDHAPGGLRRSLRDRRRPPSAILELPMDKTGRDGNSGLRRRQARCRAMRSSIRGRHSRHRYKTPYAQRVSFVPPCFRLPRRARPPPAFLHKTHSLCSAPSIRNAVFNGQFTATAKEP